MAGVFLTQLVQVVQYGFTAVLLAGYETKAQLCEGCPKTEAEFSSSCEYGQV